jgi:hypothetical protein
VVSEWPYRMVSGNSQSWFPKGCIGWLLGIVSLGFLMAAWVGSLESLVSVPTRRLGWFLVIDILVPEELSRLVIGKYHPCLTKAFLDGWFWQEAVSRRQSKSISLGQ